MFDHVEFPVGAIGASRAFFAAALQAMGYQELFFDFQSPEAGFGAGDVTGLLIFEGAPGPERLHLCLKASAADHVRAAYAAGIGAGGRDNGEPGYRTHYAPGYFAAFVFDPDGNNIEFLYRDPNAKQNHPPRA